MDKKIKNLERHKELTSTVKERLVKYKEQLQKQLRFVEKLLAKPTVGEKKSPMRRLFKR